MSEEACLFCKIANKELPADIVYEDDRVVAFRDIRPQAPVHLLVVPRAHIPAISAVTAADEGLLGHIFTVIRELAVKEGVSERGYRVVVNCGEDGLQTVFHIHFHLLGGRRLGWPPG
ncbi:MAG TPA: histidine triad nucleotide-binding protein [Limnochordia bacterium]